MNYSGTGSSGAGGYDIHPHFQITIEGISPLLVGKIFPAKEPKWDNLHGIPSLADTN